MSEESRSTKRRLRGLCVWEEEDEAAAFITQRRNGSGSGLANPFLRGLQLAHTNGALSFAGGLLCTS